MNRSIRSAGLFLLLVLVLVSRIQGQQPVTAEPQASGGTVQAPRELVPALPVPRLVKFNGVAKDELGRPRTGVVGITFAVYKDQEGGAPLWMETQNVELDEQGRYTVLLGATKSDGLPLELFSAGEPRWLGVQVNLAGEVEQPRVLLVSVPYALKALDSETLGGLPPSAFVLALPETVSGSKSKTGGKAGVNGPTAAATIGGGGSSNVVAKFDATGANVINSSISDDGSRVTVGEGMNFGSDFSFVGNAEPARTGRVQMFDRANVGFVLRGLNLLVETLQGNSFTPTEVMRWTQAGNVGIGTTTPGSRLEVSGNLKISGAGALVFPDGTVQTSSNRTRGITFLAGCDTCALLADTDSEKTIYVNVVGSMTIQSVTCYSDAGNPIINIQRDIGTAANILTSNLTCSPTGASSNSFVSGQNILNVNDAVDFAMVTAGGQAHRVTVVIQAVLN